MKRFYAIIFVALFSKVICENTIESGNVLKLFTENPSGNDQFGSIEQELEALGYQDGEDYDNMAEGQLGRSKRFTVDFMGVQVSYPQYLRLVKLQEKVVKLNQMIAKLQETYNEDQLNTLPQYHRLMALQASLLPLLPQEMREQYDVSSNRKRSPITVDFMGVRVSYPQYLRLKSLQEKAIKLDQIVSQMQAEYPMEVLVQDPRWKTLISVRDSLRKILPTENPNQQESVRRKRSPSADFNGMLVSYPQYIRLMKLQEKALRLDNIIRKVSEGRDPALLAENPKWNELVSLRRSLQKLMPLDHPSYQEEVEKSQKMNPTSKIDLLDEAQTEKAITV